MFSIGEAALIGGTGASAKKLKTEGSVSPTFVLTIKGGYKGRSTFKD